MFQSLGRVFVALYLICAVVPLWFGASSGLSASSISDAIGQVVHGWVFWDQNGNGAHDPGEGTGIESLTLTLFSGGVLVATATTGAGGYYQFVDIAPAWYVLRLDLPESLVPTSPTEWGIQVPEGHALMVNFGIRTTPAEPSATPTLLPGQSPEPTQTTTTTPTATPSPVYSPTVPVLLGAIHGWVYIDASGNGVHEPDEEPGLAGATLVLEQGGTVVRTTTSTGPTGWYDFAGVPAGVYALKMLLPPHYGATSPLAWMFEVPPSVMVNFGVQDRGPDPTETPLAVVVPTETHTPAPTATETPVPTETSTPTETSIPTETNAPTERPTATSTPTETSIPTETNTPADTPTGTPTERPTATSTRSATATVTRSPTTAATMTSTSTPTVKPVITRTTGTPGPDGQRLLLPVIMLEEA